LEIDETYYSETEVSTLRLSILRVDPEPLESRRRVNNKQIVYGPSPVPYGLCARKMIKNPSNPRFFLKRGPERKRWNT
jgi:hypothetical protein